MSLEFLAVDDRDSAAVFTDVDPGNTWAAVGHRGAVESGSEKVKVPPCSAPAGVRSSREPREFADGVNQPKSQESQDSSLWRKSESVKLTLGGLVVLSARASWPPKCLNPKFRYSGIDCQHLLLLLGYKHRTSALWSHSQTTASTTSTVAEGCPREHESFSTSTPLSLISLLLEFLLSGPVSRAEQGHTQHTASSN